MSSGKKSSAQAGKDAAAAVVSMAALSPSFGKAGERWWPGEPVVGSTIEKGIYVLAKDRQTSTMAARAFAAKTAADAAGKALKASVEELRAFGEAARTACASLHKAGAGGGEVLPSVKIPYVDLDGAERSAMVTVSQRYKVEQDVAKAREDLGEVYDACIVSEDTYVVTPKGLDVLRGLLAEKGLKGGQIDAVIEQICDKTTTFSASEDYELVRGRLPRKKQETLDKYVTRAEASVKL